MRQILFGESAPAVLAEPRSWAEPADWVVTGYVQESPDVVTLEFAPPEPLEFLPGQFTMLYLPGIGEVPISISGDPVVTDRITHTIRDVGPVTRALCALRPGDHAGARGPYGTSWPVAAAAGGDVLIVAGGIGLPPLRPAIYAALRDRDQFGRIALLYGARTPADLLFPAELATWRAAPGFDVQVTVDREDESWHGNVGVVPALIGPLLSSTRRFTPESATAFVVGPEIMMRFTVRALLEAGVPSDRVYLSMERNMQCGAALCGHCQLGPFLICRDGPVFGYRQLAPWLEVAEL